MSNTGNKDAQNIDEMISTMEAAKEQGLSTRRGQSIYKKESGQYQEDKLKALVAMNIGEVATFATKKRVSLEDVNEVRERTIMYLKACEASGTFPNSMGLARSLGYSSRALRHWRSNKPQTETAQWLEMFSDTCADILSQSALKNNANTIMAIFLNKALYEMRETSEIVIKPGSDIEPEQSFSVEDIRKRYLIGEVN